MSMVLHSLKLALYLVTGNSEKFEFDKFELDQKLEKFLSNFVKKVQFDKIKATTIEGDFSFLAPFVKIK